MQKKRKDNQFIKQAYYNGGNTAFRKFVSEQLKYPEEALKKDIEGVGHLKIDIDHKGKVTGVKVMKGIGYGCDEEAMRIMRNAIYEVPANPKKVRVIFHKNIRIQFKKPIVKKTPVVKPGIKPEKKNKLGIEYVVTKKPGVSKSVGKDSGKTSYNYTINF